MVMVTGKGLDQLIRDALVSLQHRMNNFEGGQRFHNAIERGRIKPRRLDLVG